MFERIIITGGCGFIGLYVVEKFYKEYPKSSIVILDAMKYSTTPIHNLSINVPVIIQDITDMNKLSLFISEFKPTLILHLAAETHVDLSYYTSSNFIDVNVQGTHNLLECVKNICSDCVFMHMSTDEVYGSMKEKTLIPIDESGPMKPTNPYAASKAAAEMLVHAYTVSYNLKSFIVRCNNAYGPRQYPEKIIAKFAMALLSNKKCTIHGDGNAYSRHYIHAYDIAEAIHFIVKYGYKENNIPNIYNISSNDEYTNMEIFKQILGHIYPNVISIDNFYTVIQDRPFNDLHYPINDNKLKSLGFKQTISWEKGLQETLEWYKTNGQTWWYNPCSIKNVCRVCGNSNLINVINLGLQTPANSYNSKGNDKYPLGLNVCQECWHSQLTHVVDPTILFKNYMSMREYQKRCVAILNSSQSMQINIILIILKIKKLY